MKRKIIYCLIALVVLGIGSSVYAYSNSKTVGILNEKDFEGKEVLVSQETEILPDGYVAIYETYEFFPE